MHIVALNGSYRGTRGKTHTLLSRMAQGAEGAGATFELLTLARYKVNRCLSCGKCQEPSCALRCVNEDRDDCANLFARMDQADILVFATPVYMLGMSVLLKNLLDRTYAQSPIAETIVTPGGMLYHPVPGMLHTPFVALITCANFEASTPATVRHFFRNHARFNGAECVGELLRNMSDLFPYPNEKDFQPHFERVVDVLAAYEQAGSDLASLGRITRRVQRQANQELPPVPLFGLLKRWVPFKRRIAEYMAQELA